MWLTVDSCGVDLSAKPSRAPKMESLQRRVHHPHILNNTLRIMEASCGIVDICRPPGPRPSRFLAICSTES
jgi:hypothetical protein